MNTHVRTFVPAETIFCAIIKITKKKGSSNSAQSTEIK